MIDIVYYVRVGIYCGTAATRTDAERMEADFIRMSNELDHSFDVNTGYVVRKKPVDNII